MNITVKFHFSKLFAKFFFASIIFFLSGVEVSKAHKVALSNNINITQFYAALESEDTAKINSFLEILTDDTAS